MTALDNEHVHHFEPWPGECGVYRCACGASGYRRDGEVRPHRSPWQVAQACAAARDAALDDAEDASLSVEVYDATAREITDHIRALKEKPDAG